MRKFIDKTKIIIVAALCLVISASVFAGCGTFFQPTDYEFGFNEPSKILYVGDVWRIKNDDFSVDQTTESFGISDISVTQQSSSDENQTKVVSVNGKTVTAVSAGTATVVATAANGKTAECTITVRDKLRSFSLEARERAVKVGEEATIFAILNDTDVANSGVHWNIGGTAPTYSGGEYSLVGNSAGKTYVTASYTATGKTLTAETDVYFYDATGSEFDVDGIDVTKTESSSGAVFALGGISEGTAAIEWTINDIPATEFTDKTALTVSPTEAGKYEIGVSVNGSALSCEPYVKSGARVPSGVTVDFDRNDRNILVSWDKAGEDEVFTVEYRVAGGKWKSAQTVGNSVLLNRYSDSSFSSFAIDLTKTTEYRVRSDGNGSYLEQSDFSTVVSVEPIKLEAISYINRKWYGGNYYITSDDEFCAIYDYFMLFREQPVNGSTSGGEEVYLGYESKYTLDRLCTIAFNRANYTGSYSTGYSKTGNILKITITFNTVSEPSVSTANKEKNTALNGFVPHLSKTGWGETDLPIESVSETAAVETTDQLYRVVEAGVKPVPKEGSRAEEYYALAKATVREITDPEMNDYEKVHAIYDWILSRVVYATYASNVTEISEAVKVDAFYLEGVFDNGFYAVCDGRSKAVSLMCNLAGVKCIRVVGTAGEADRYGNRGGHAWNKVCADGKWYAVDTTWGDVSTTFNYGVYTYSREIETHAYLFKTDRQLATSHFENPYGVYPKTAAVPYDVYDTMTFAANGAEYACRLTDEENADTLGEALKSYIKSELRSGKRSFSLPYAVYDKATKTVSIKKENIKSEFVTTEFSVAGNYEGGASAAKETIAKIITPSGGLFGFSQELGNISFTDGNAVRITAWKK